VKRLILLLSCIAIVLTACSGPSLTAGKVIDKQYLPEQTGWWLQPIPQEHCSSAGKFVDCFTSFIFIPVWYTNPAEWQLQLKQGQQTAWIDVDPTVYPTIHLGQWYGKKSKPARNRPGLSKQKP